MEEKNKKPVDPPEPENEFDNEPESDLKQESENETVSDYESKQETENDAEYNDTVDEEVIEETEESPEEPEHFFNNKPDSDNSSKSNFGQPASVDEEKKKHSTVFTTIFIILTLSVVAIYYLISNGADGLFSEKTTETSETTEESETDTEKLEKETEKETEISRDGETATALFGKLFALHIPTTQDDYKTYGGLEKNTSFDFRGAYNVNELLYPDASEFDNKAKLSIITRQLYNSNKFEDISKFNVPNDYFKEKFPEYCEGTAIDEMCSNNKGLAISEETVSNYYKKLFGEKPTFENPTSLCGAPAYDSEYHLFYETIQACGGVDVINHQLYVTKYSQKDNEAYVYIALNTINEDSSINGNVTVYKKYLKLSDFYDSELQKDKEIDSSYIYKTANEAETSKLFITEENYNEFDQFRFIFEKDTDNNYFFKGVEKL